MQSLETLRHASICQYVPGDTVIHRMDVRVKLLCLLSLITAATICGSYVSHVALLSLCLLATASMRVPLRRVLASIKPALPIIAFMSTLQLLFHGDPTPTDTILYQSGIVSITASSIRSVVVSLSRLLELLSLVTLLTSAATMAQLSHGIAWFLRPLDAIGLPGDEMSLVFTIALRFLPILALQLETLAKAQISRGGNLSTRGRWKFVGTTRRALALVVPLFLDAFRRSERLAVAMEARCCTGGSRARRSTEHSAWRIGDLALTVGVALLSLALIVGDQIILH